MHHAILHVCSLIALIAGSPVTSGENEMSVAHGRASNDSRVSSHTIFVVPPQDKKPAPSDAERQAAKKINDAAGPEAKLQAAAEFVKKYPKSSLRPEVARALETAVLGIQDRALKVSAAQTYLEIFNEPAEIDAFQPILIEAQLDNNQIEESFRSAGVWLAKHPDELAVLLRLAVSGANEATRGNTNFQQQAEQYGLKAIELIETDKKPAAFEASQWPEFKARWLPLLYREMGVIAVRASKPAEAKTRLEKAIALKSVDPVVYAIVGGIADEEYEGLAKSYKSAPAGAGADALLKKAQDQMDKVIELYAQAIAHSEGKPEYKQVVDQLTPALQNYFKFRHNGSTDGLRQLIDKYKTPAATP